MSLAQNTQSRPTHPSAKLLDRLNGAWHRRALLMYMVVVLAHWAEHILQAMQVYLLGWPRPTAHGALGLAMPWLITSEWLHYSYALVMLIGLIVLRRSFVGRAGAWWSLALWLQVWHHFEHGLLLSQALLQTNLFGFAAPVSILQLVFPRMELHLFYNAVVFVPMIIAMWLHLHPLEAEARHASCTCARRQRLEPLEI
ncbi:MAG TPA: hypothetical protein VFZ66_26740 [Herpetosiphonaceae bacterium]